MVRANTHRRTGWTLLLAGALAACAGGLGATAPSSAPRTRSVALVTRGGNVAYSAAQRKIAFSRFDTRVIGGPDASGRSDGTGTFQLFVAEPDGSRERCLSCADAPGGPRRNQHVGAPTWHASGEWMVVAVEMPRHRAPHAKCHPGFGAYVDLWAVTPDGRQWRQLTHYASAVDRPRFPETPAGALIPRFSRSGRRLVWAEMIGYDARHPFAIWRLARAEFVTDALGPRLLDKVTATPGVPGTTFYEAWSFSPDDSLVTVASESGGIHPGFMDVQLWSPEQGTLRNLTRTNGEYEEQAVFSPDGRHIAFMSTRDQSPRYDPSGDFWGTFRTDVWVMNADGTGAERLTHFSDPAYAEYLPGAAVTRAFPVAWAPDGRSLYVDVSQNRGSTQTHETARIYRVTLDDR
jgi:dipeptidyl aminopeptidase/acylaminoacyl peptidase